MIEVYEDVIADECLFSAGAGGSRTRFNDRSTNPAGYATVNAVRDLTLKTFGLASISMSIEAYNEVIRLYEVTDAGTYGFLMLDPVDQTVDATEGKLQGYMAGVESGSIGFGNGTATYGFRKYWSVASRSRSSAITRPISPAITRGGSPVVAGVGAGNISINATGPKYVTFVPDATRTVTGVTVGATTQVTLNSAIGVVIGGRLWLQGLTGADAALLNGLSHAVTNISGGGLNVYTLATSTAGKTITVGAGAGHKYPQPDEALVWTGDFYTPVHFAMDNLDWELVRPGNYEDRLLAGPTVALEEVREA